MLFFFKHRVLSNVKLNNGTQFIAFELIWLLYMILHMIVIWRYKNIPVKIVKLISNMKLSSNVHFVLLWKGYYIFSVEVLKSIKFALKKVCSNPAIQEESCYSRLVWNQFWFINNYIFNHFIIFNYCCTPKIPCLQYIS